MTAKELFAATDELQFKRDYVLKFLASHDAVEFQNNCHRGWSNHKPRVEDAAALADRVWDEWCEMFGLLVLEDAT